MNDKFESMKNQTHDLLADYYAECVVTAIRIKRGNFVDLLNQEIAELKRKEMKMDYKKLLEKIKKGLECCSPYTKKCDTCPYLDKVGGSCNYLTTDSLEVVNELSRELYKYGSENEGLLKQIETMRIENESLRQRIDNEEKIDRLYNDAIRKMRVYSDK